MADLRDDKVVRASYLSQLLDLDGSDVKKVYEPISHQIGYLLTFVVLLMTCHFMWKRYRRWKEENTAQFIPYKIVKPPSSMISEQETVKGETRKRVCAVVGGTGFIGSHIVDELVRRKNYYVFVLGRKFRPERTNPDADCLIQVDMLDQDGLISAFQGVDSVINAAAVVPTVFYSADNTYSKNRLAFSNVLVAAQKAGVKNLIHLSGFPPAVNFKDKVFGAFMNALESSSKDILAANAEGGLQTCVIAPTNITGINSSFLDKILSGETTSSPMSDNMPCSFMPVEYLTKALVNAEEKLATPASAEAVAGKFFPLRGEPMSWKTFFNLPGWPHKIANVSPVIMQVLVQVNVICASLFSWAPLGGELVPGLMELLSFVEEDIPEAEIQEAYKALGVGPPHPSMAEYIPMMVEQYKAKHGDKKNQ